MPWLHASQRYNIGFKTSVVHPRTLFLIGGGGGKELPVQFLEGRILLIVLQFYENRGYHRTSTTEPHCKVRQPLHTRLDKITRRRTVINSSLDGWFSLTIDKEMSSINSKIGRIMPIYVERWMLRFLTGNDTIRAWLEDRLQFITCRAQIRKSEWADSL